MPLPCPVGGGPAEAVALEGLSDRGRGFAGEDQLYPVFLDVLDRERCVVAASFIRVTIGPGDLVFFENPVQVGAGDPSHGDVRQGHVLQLKGDPLRVLFDAAEEIALKKMSKEDPCVTDTQETKSLKKPKLDY